MLITTSTSIHQNIRKPIPPIGDRRTELLIGRSDAHLGIEVDGDFLPFNLGERVEHVSGNGNSRVPASWVSYPSGFRIPTTAWTFRYDSREVGALFDSVLSRSEHLSLQGENLFGRCRDALATETRETTVRKKLQSQLEIEDHDERRATLRVVQRLGMDASTYVDTMTECLLGHLKSLEGGGLLPPEYGDLFCHNFFRLGGATIGLYDSLTQSSSQHYKLWKVAAIRFRDTWGRYVSDHGEWSADAGWHYWNARGTGNDGPPVARIFLSPDPMHPEEHFWRVGRALMNLGLVDKVDFKISSTHHRHDGVVVYFSCENVDFAYRLLDELVTASPPVVFGGEGVKGALPIYDLPALRGAPGEEFMTHLLLRREHSYHALICGLFTLAWCAPDRADTVELPKARQNFASLMRVAMMAR